MNWPFRTESGWKWWMRFRNHDAAIHTKGCHYNSHGDVGECPCAKEQQVAEDTLKDMGYDLVAVCNWGFLWYRDTKGTQSLLRQYHDWGR